VKASWNSVYVGPYEGTLLQIGADPTHASISLYCVDFLHYALPNKVVTASVSVLGEGDTSLTRLKAGGLLAYQKAAFLSSLFHSYGSVAQFSGLTQAQAWSGIHGAIWYFTSGAGAYSADPYWGAFRDYANGNYASYTGYNQWAVLTTKSIEASRLQDSQEFLVQMPPPPPPVVPEPASYLLMAVGVLLLLFFGRSRIREAESS
jgi:hypothetical protein